jgi:hypothetical protein
VRRNGAEKQPEEPPQASRLTLTSSPANAHSRVEEKVISIPITGRAHASRATDRYRLSWNGQRILPHKKRYRLPFISSAFREVCQERAAGEGSRRGPTCTWLRRRTWIADIALRREVSGRLHCDKFLRASYVSRHTHHLHILVQMKSRIIALIHRVAGQRGNSPNHAPVFYSTRFGKGNDDSGPSGVFRWRKTHQRRLSALLRAV